MILVPQPRIDDYVARGWWSELTLARQFIDTACAQPQAFAVADPPNRSEATGLARRELTWGELLTDVGQMAACLNASGLRKDDVIVAQLPNGVDLHVLYLACAATGIVISPVPMQFRAHELVQVVAATQARAAFTVTRMGQHEPAAHWLAHRAAMPTLTSIWAQGEQRPAGVLALDDRRRAASAWDAQDLARHMDGIGLTAHDVLTICWTSGTEAAPKGVPRNHNEWRIVGRSVVEAAQLAPGARMVIPFPFVNMAGVSTSLAAWLLVGGGLHHHHPFDLDQFIGQLRDYPIDYTVAAPAVLSLLLKEPQRLAGLDFSRLTRIGSGGGPLSDWVVEQFAERFGVEVVNYYGSNEGAALSSTPQDVPDRQQRSRYFPRFGVPGFRWSVSNAERVSTRLVDPDTGVTIDEADRVGELRFRGPTIFSGYFNAPELTARAFDEHGYYRTGDLFTIAGDAKQFYAFRGRLKDIVIRGGMNISSEEVEGLLLAHPSVREVAVVGLPDPVMGERVCAVVVLQPLATLTLPELTTWLRDAKQVSAYKWPERLVLWDSLPRNPVGKVLKREIRDALRQQALREAAHPTDSGPLQSSTEPMRPVLLLMAGMLCDEAVWAEVAPRLAAVAEVRCLAFPAADTIAAMADAAWARIEDVPPASPVVLAGFSMGGYVVQRMLVETRRPIAAAALIASTLLPDSEPARAGRVQTMAALRADFPAFVNRLLRWSMSAGADPIAVDRVRGMLMRVGADAGIRHAQAIAGRDDLRSDLARLAIPVTVMAGDVDGLVTPAAAGASAGLMPGARFVQVDGAGHMLPVERPERVAAELAALLASLGPAHADNPNELTGDPR